MSLTNGMKTSLVPRLEDNLTSKDVHEKIQECDLISSVTRYANKAVHAVNLTNLF